MSYRHTLALSLAVEALKAEPPKRWKPERTARVIELLKEVANLLPDEEPESEFSRWVEAHAGSTS